MKDPTSYDGEYSIADLHPSMRDAELYPAMRDLDDEDLRLMAATSWCRPKSRAAPGVAARSTSDQLLPSNSNQNHLSPAASGRRGFLLGTHLLRCHGVGMAAVPPLLQIPAEANGEKGQHSGCGSSTRLQKFHRVGGATPSRQVGNKPPSDPSPARLLAAPGQATAGPGQFFAIKQPATGPDDTEAVLTAGAGVNAAGLQKIVDFGATHGRRRQGTRMEDDQTKKNHPRRSGLRTRPVEGQRLNRALLRRGS